MIDLHTHSSASDGSKSPSELARHAAELGISSIALTDHNTVDGLPDFITTCNNYRIRPVPGIEISCMYKKTELHILALNLPEDKFSEAKEFMGSYQKSKEQSNIHLINKLNEAGYNIDYEELKKARGGNINRAVIAVELISKGYFSDVKEAFAKVLGEECGLYIPPKRIDALDLIPQIIKWNAIPVWAHPYLTLKKDEDVRDFLEKAVPSGLMALEAYYSKYSEDETKMALRAADDFGILVSGGSDYHGEAKKDIQVGVGKGNLLISEEVLSKLLQAQKNMIVSKE